MPLFCISCEKRDSKFSITGTNTFLNNMMVQPQNLYELFYSSEINSCNWHSYKCELDIRNCYSIPLFQNNLFVLNCWYSLIGIVACPVSCKGFYYIVLITRKVSKWCSKCLRKFCIIHFVTCDSREGLELQSPVIRYWQFV